MNHINDKGDPMAPNLLGAASPLFLAEPTTQDHHQIIGKQKIHYDSTIHPKITRKLDGPQYRWQIVWRNVLAFVYLHVFAVYGLYLALFVAPIRLFALAIVSGCINSQGVTAGAHRLWAHRTYKAKLPLRIFLMLLQTMAFQNHIYEWVRDHRVHHKFTDTDADPHNAKRGFFFSHMGWLMVRKHRDVLEKGKSVDLSDLEADPVVMFQKKFYLILMPLLCFGFPVLTPWYFWGDNIYQCWYICGVLRYVLLLNGTWLVNSAAHIWGMKPYDKNIGPTENKYVSMAAFGEGWHNYHHVFPWDYKAAELGTYKMNLSTGFIDLMAKIGQAYDLKTASQEIIMKRCQRTGDGSRWQKNDEEEDNHEHPIGKDATWGWGDKDMPEDEIKEIRIYNKLKEN